MLLSVVGARIGCCCWRRLTHPFPVGVAVSALPALRWWRIGANIDFGSGTSRVGWRWRCWLLIGCVLVFYTPAPEQICMCSHDVPTIVNGDGDGGAEFGTDRGDIGWTC
jgi:hypothetical protein